VFHWGNSLSSKQANFQGDHPFGGAEKGPTVGKTAKVGSYQANAWGLFDMHGNVWEWCLDEPRPYTSNLAVDPKGSDTVNGMRMERGGSWRDAAWYCRSTLRVPRAPSGRSDNIGFRVVCEQQR
jgi:formylglycine-generating enzyme required for sulfatase activity